MLLGQKRKRVRVRFSSWGLAWSLRESSREWGDRGPASQLTSARDSPPATPKAVTMREVTRDHQQKSIGLVEAAASISKASDPVSPTVLTGIVRRSTRVNTAASMPECHTSRISAALRVFPPQPRLLPGLE